MTTHLKFGSRRVPLPGSPVVRIGLGVLLICGGVLGFLPILGFWMVPLGVIVLSVDIPAVRRFPQADRSEVGRWRQRRRAEKEQRERA